MGQSSQEVTASLQELVTALLVSTVTKLLLQGRVSSNTAEQTQQNVAKPSASATGPNSNLRNTRNRNTGGGGSLAGSGSGEKHHRVGEKSDFITPEVRE